MKYAGTGLLALLLLGGCVTKELNQGLDFLIGQNVSIAASRLGYPDEQREFQGDQIYIWRRSGSFAMPVTTQSTTYGNIGTTPVFGTTSNTGYVNQSVACTIQMSAGTDGIIKTWHWEGNLVACEGYARALSR